MYDAVKSPVIFSPTVTVSFCAAQVEDEGLRRPGGHVGHRVAGVARLAGVAVVAADALGGRRSAGWRGPRARRARMPATLPAGSCRWVQRGRRQRLALSRGTSRFTAPASTLACTPGGSAASSQAVLVAAAAEALLAGAAAEPDVLVGDGVATPCRATLTVVPIANLSMSCMCNGTLAGTWAANEPSSADGHLAVQRLAVELGGAEAADALLAPEKPSMRRALTTLPAGIGAERRVRRRSGSRWWCWCC